MGAVAPAGGVDPASAARSRFAGLRRPRIDLFDLAVLAAFAGFSLWVVALDVWQVVVHDRSWTGTDGGYGLPDQMQHLAWVRDASSHVLVSNLFVLDDTPHDYLQPAVVVSGALAAIGVAPWLALMLWKPVGVVWVFLAVRRYVGRTLEGRAARRGALVLALFFVGWGVLVAEQFAAPGTFPDDGWLFHTQDAWLAFWSWGYLFGLLSAGAMVSGLLAYASARAAGRIGWAAPLLGALTCWLHPWQGETFILLVLCAEALMWARGDRPRARQVAVTVLAAAAPFAYYAVLRETDLSWRLGQDAGRHPWPVLMSVLTLLPLALPAAIAYRAGFRGFLAGATRVWPVAALAIYFLNETQLGRGPTHALLGVTVPLAVLAVEGARTATRRLAVPRRHVFGALAVAALVLPPAANAMWDRKTALFQDAAEGTSANFVAAGERRALDFLADDERAGGVVARLRLGTVVPALTGRHTLVGNFFWSHDFAGALELADRLFLRGYAPPRQARQAAGTLTAMSGARFVLAGCDTTNDVRGLLGPAVEDVRRFGCATVYVLRADRTASGRAHAAVPLRGP